MRSDTLRRHRDQGFTLIELLIVIVVLGILAATAIFALNGVTPKAVVAACQADGATLQSAIADANTLNAGNVVTSAQTEGTFVGSGKGVQQWPTGKGFAFTLVKGVLNVALNGGTPTPYTGPSSCDPPPAPTVATLASFTSNLGSEVVDSSGNIITATANGIYLTPAATGTLYGHSVTAGTPYDLGGFFSGNELLAVDHSGNIYIYDAVNGTYQPFYVLAATTGTLNGQAVTAGQITKLTSPASQINVSGLATNASGTPTYANGYPGNMTYLGTDPAGDVFGWSPQYKSFSVWSTAPGVSSSSFNGVAAGAYAVGNNMQSSFAVDPSGNVYFEDQSYKLEVIPAASGVLFGQNVVADTPVVLQAASSIGWPSQIATNAQGDLIVGDPGNRTVYEIKP